MKFKQLPTRIFLAHRLFLYPTNIILCHGSALFCGCNNTLRTVQEFTFLLSSSFATCVLFGLAQHFRSWRTGCSRTAMLIES